MRRSRSLLLLLALALPPASACDDGGGKEADPHAEPAPKKEPPRAPVFDAGPSADAAVPARPPERGDLDGFHLDPEGIEYEVPDRPRPADREAKPIELMLRSTPAGAQAAVDGAPVGRTPALWRGTADGRPHEFTFVLSGYAMARYRFVPTQDGIVHGTLRRLTVVQQDAGPPP